MQPPVDAEPSKLAGGDSVPGLATGDASESANWAKLERASSKLRPLK